MTAKSVPFSLSIGDRDIADLHSRLARTRFPDQAPGDAWRFGTDVDYLQTLTDYWRTGFDWRAEEAGSFPNPTDEEHRYLQLVVRWTQEEAGYAAIQGTRPQSLAFAPVECHAAWRPFRGTRTTGFACSGNPCIFSIASITSGMTHCRAHGDEAVSVASRTPADSCSHL